MKDSPDTVITRMADFASSHTRNDAADEVLQALVQWERDARFLEFRWLGVAPWRLLRKELIVAHLADRGVRGKTNYNMPGLRQFGWMLLGAAQSVSHLFRLRKRPYLFIGFPRRRKDQDGWVDPFSDPLMDLLGDDQSICIEKPFTGKHFRPAKTRRIIYYDGLMGVAVISGWLFSWAVGMLARRRLAGLTSRISERLGIDESSLRRLIARTVIRFWVEEIGMRFVVDIVRPRTLLFTNRWIHAAAIHAAKRRGIKVCELQHGAVPPNGFGYATPFDPDLDPDWMFTFGPYWNKFDWGLPRERVVAVGHRDIWQRRRRTGSAGGQRVMLVSRPGRHVALSACFMEIVRRHEDRDFVLRLHPQDVHDWQNRYPVGTLPNVTISSEFQESLFDAFSECSVVVGSDSTVLYEAAFFGLKVGILNFDGTIASAALEYAGRGNFHEIRNLTDLDRLLISGPANAASESPFFAEFDAARFLELVR